MKVSGPFIEYRCAVCDALVSEKVHIKSIERRMEEVREDKTPTACASCGHKGK